VKEKDFTEKGPLNRRAAKMLSIYDLVYILSPEVLPFSEVKFDMQE